MAPDGRVTTGLPALDDVLDGGLPPRRAYMLRGDPGTGKTILGMHFLTAGDGAGEDALCVHFEESSEEIVANAEALGFDLSGVEFLDLSPEADVFTDDRTYAIFGPDEVEGGSVADRVTTAVEAVDPARVFVDPLTHLRHFAPDDYQFRRQVASLVAYLTDLGATVLFSTQPTATAPDDDLQFLADGALELRRGEKGRTLEVAKLRGSGFRSGEHTVRITEEGIRLFPRLVPATHDRPFDAETVPSNVAGLDALLGGGIERGTVTVVSGPSGVGKTTTGSVFMSAAAARGERSVIYMFEESAETFLHRSEAVGIPVGQMRERGTLAIEEVEPVSISPDEFAAMVRAEVEERDARVVMIDGISGYRLSIRGDEDELVRELHSLVRYLRNMGVTVVLVDDVPSVTGEFAATSTRISYLGDNILFMRYLEVDAELRKAIGVLKKRAGDFERRLREFAITGDGIRVGDPLQGLHGVLTGTPESRGDGVAGEGERADRDR
jgi:circadian clock protein KaiC